MSNSLRGDVAFVAGDVTYTLCYSVNALVTLEEASGKTFPVIASELSDATKLSMGLIRLVLWAGLQEHHKGISAVDAGELIPQIGTMLDAVGVVSKALSAAFPQQKDATAAGDPPKPSQSGGTGSAS